MNQLCSDVDGEKFVPTPCVCVCVCVCVQCLKITCAMRWKLIASDEANGTLTRGASTSLAVNRTFARVALFDEVLIVNTCFAPSVGMG